MPFDLSGVVQDLAPAAQVLVFRSSADTYTNGRLDTPATVVNILVTAVVEPISPRDLQRLPEGSRIQDATSLWTDTELFTQGLGQAPDVFQVDGDLYQVQSVQAWGTMGNYWKVIGLRQGH